MPSVNCTTCIGEHDRQNHAEHDCVLGDILSFIVTPDGMKHSCCKNNRLFWSLQTAGYVLAAQRHKAVRRI